MARVGAAQRKALLLLEAGVALAFAGSPRTSFRIMRHVAREWRAIDRAVLRSAIQRLYQSKLIDTRDHPDGTTTIILTEEGKQRCLTYRIDEMSVQRPKSWDRKWRLILFDIPEKRRAIRDALRHHLRRLGCHELQRSVFVHPFDCRDEVEFLIEFYQARPFVRFAIADDIDNALHLKQKFKI